MLSSKQLDHAKFLKMMIFNNRTTYRRLKKERKENEEDVKKGGTR